jgi:eukaryotic-like serine/threonine-protein kinase
MSAPWPEELPAGFEFDRFTILGHVRRGSVASVYRAACTERGVVALKVYERPASDRGPDQRRLMRNLRAAADARHPNLAAILAVGVWRERAYVATEWLDGCDLETYLERWGVMLEEEVAELGLHLCSGLLALHAAGAAHGDIKPGSIFLCDGSDGDVVPKLIISDLPHVNGLASPVDSTTREIALSTPAYLAPESIRGRPGGPAADQYSVGAVLYTCAVGHPPYVGGGLLELLRAIALAEITPPCSVRPELSRALEAVILRALRTEPEARFGGMRELGYALWPLVSERARDAWARSFGGDPVSAAATAGSDAELGPSKHRASKRPVWFLLAASVALSIGIGAFYLYSVRSNSARSSPAVAPGAALGAPF